MEVCKALKILHVDTWPKDIETLKIYGQKELTVISNPFEMILSNQLVNVDAAAVEWGSFVTMCTAT